MLNIFILTIPVACYSSSFFWHLLFCAIAVNRYLFNHHKEILIISVVGTFTVLYLYFIPPLLAFKSFILFQFLICFIDILYNLYRRNWNNNVVFFWAESFLAIILLFYIFGSQYTSELLFFIKLWLGAYISFELILFLKSLSKYKFKLAAFFQKSDDKVKPVCIMLHKDDFQSVSINGKRIKFGPVSGRIIHYLASNTSLGRYHPTEEIQEYMKRQGYPIEQYSVRNRIADIRGKIKEEFNGKKAITSNIITNERRFGYRINCAVEKEI